MRTTEVVVGCTSLSACTLFAARSTCPNHLFLAPCGPSPFPPASQGRDVLAVSVAGSGKTLSYLLPALASLSNRSRDGTKNSASPDVVVLVPTRELAEQVELGAGWSTAGTGAADGPGDGPLGRACAYCLGCRGTGM